ncbi:CAAX prenyl protease 2 homolog [Panonychus citri]|uniref:CAAX prenyl protease 2 homolog n=1 Tax=Panonychus citri TaxID=50023 RepID=UPI002307CF2F|nr:CAAX prenyl protease 2 homolog [Panonychus citri]
MSCYRNTVILSAIISIITVLFVKIFTFDGDPVIAVATRFMGKMFSAMAAIVILQTIGYLDIDDLIPEFTLLTYDQFIDTYVIPLSITMGFFNGIILDKLIYGNQGILPRSSTEDKCSYLILGPISEEFIYRVILINLLRHCYSPSISGIIASVFFSLSHSHYHLNLRRLLGRCQWFPFFFHTLSTLVFGLYASLIYLRVQSTVVVIIIHSFFNYMGLIRVERVFKQWWLYITDFIGVIIAMISLYFFIRDSVTN